jgi:hypothetical protein
MERQEVSTVCEECRGTSVAFLWVRDTATDGRWVINEALNTKNKGSEKTLGCRCGKN